MNCGTVVSPNIDLSSHKNRLFLYSKNEVRKTLIKDEKIKNTIQQDQPKAYQQFKMSINSLNF